MKIALVSEHASPLAALGGADAGGQNVCVDALARHLGRMGHDVVVHTRRDDPALPAQVALEPRVTVDHVDAGPPRALPKDDLLAHMDRFAEQLAAAWCADPPDVAHSHFWMSGMAALAAAAPLRIPLVHTFHALGVVKRRHQGAGDTSPLARIGEERRLAAHADRILATCRDEVRELEALGASRDRIDVVPCGVDLDRFDPQGPSWPRSGRPRLLALARLVPRKGVDDAIRALPGLPGAELVVAGGPPSSALNTDPEIGRLREIADSLAVADRVEMLGRVGRDDAPRLLRSADLVLCVPWYEPFGIVPLEAMACGVPVIATAVGGMLDTVVDGRTGVLVAPRDPQALAAAAGALLADPARRRRMGWAGVQRARRRYGWPRVARSALLAFERARSQRRHAQAVVG